MNSIDYLIVGGGIAGLTIADILENKEQKIIIVDQWMEGTASLQSAGVINPVTGMRFVKSWNFEEIQKSFLYFYSGLEQKLKIRFIRTCKLIQLLKNPDEENRWMSRTAETEYASYVSDLCESPPGGIRQTENDSYAVLKNVHLIDVDQLMNHWMDYFKKKSIFVQQKFDLSELIRTPQALMWNKYHISKGIIFCEGYRILENPFFNWLPIYKLKGEYTQFYSEELKLEHIYKSEYSIVPLSENKYWCGSNFSLEDSSLNCTETEMYKQSEFLKKQLNAPFEILSHGYGIRPSTKDRRPIAGRHSEDPRLAVLTGFGTKGYSLAPYCAKYLADHLLGKASIPYSISCDRFKGVI